MRTKWLQKFLRRKQPPIEPTKPLNWREEISKEQITREEFCSLCVVAIQQMCPAAVLEPIELPDQYRLIRPQHEPITICFENIWRQSRLGSRYPGRPSRAFCKGVLGCQEQPRYFA